MTALGVLTRDGRLLFLTRFTRLFAYGALSVVLVFYLTNLGFDTSQVGVLLTLTLVGDVVVSLLLTTRQTSDSTWWYVIDFTWPGSLPSDMKQTRLPWPRSTHLPPGGGLQSTAQGEGEGVGDEETRRGGDD